MLAATDQATSNAAAAAAAAADIQMVNVLVLLNRDRDRGCVIFESEKEYTVANSLYTFIVGGKRGFELFQKYKNR